LGALRLRHITMPRWTAPFYKPTAVLPWLLFKIVRILLGILRVMATPADVYHAADLAALPGCYLAAVLRRKPLIFETYELPLVEPHVLRRRVVHAISAGALRAMMPRCTAVITVSPPLVGEMRTRYGGRPAVVVRNVPTYQPPQRSDRLRLALGLPATTRVALYQGGLQADRGLGRLVAAGHHLPPDVVLAIMGDGPERAILAAQIDREGLSERVRLLPPVPYAELLGWTASADLGLIIYPPSHSPNVRFCLPNKLFEYLMAGVPVLASPLDEVAALLRAYGVGGVVASVEPAAVGSAIGALLADPAALARMRAHALAACAQDLRWDVEREVLLRLYASAIASGTA
jgi:glycosyltransferase involved in cell wall biosynthesis